MAPTNLLQRSDSDSVVAGVCGGIARQYRIDPLLVRLGAVILALSSGVGLVLYGAAWLLLPRGTGKPALAQVFPTVARVRSRTWILVVTAAALLALVLVGIIFSASLLPTMVVLGVLYASQLRPGNKVSAPAVAAAAPQTYPTRPVPAAAPAGAQWPLLAPPAGELIITTPAGPWRPTNRFGQPLTAQDCAAFYAVPDPIGLYERPAMAVPVRRSRIFALVSGLAIAALFAMMSLLGAFVAVPPVTYLAVGLVGVGLALIVGAFVGRPSGFIAIAVVLVLVAGGVSGNAPMAADTTIQAYSSTTNLPDQVTCNGNYSLDLSQLQIEASKGLAVLVDRGNASIVLPASGNYSVTWDDTYGNVSMPNGSDDQTGSYEHIVDPTQPIVSISVTVTRGNLDVTEA